MFGRGTKARDGSGQGICRSPSLRVVLWSWHCTFGWKTCLKTCRGQNIGWTFSHKKGDGHLQLSPIQNDLDEPYIYGQLMDISNLEWFRWAIMESHIIYGWPSYTRNIACFDRGTSGRVSSSSVGLRRLCFGIAWDPHLAAQHLRRVWFVLGVELDTSWLGFSALIAVSGVLWLEGRSVVSL